MKRKGRKEGGKTEGGGRDVEKVEEIMERGRDRKRGGGKGDVKGSRNGRKGREGRGGGCEKKGEMGKRKE